MFEGHHENEPVTSGAVRPNFRYSSLVDLGGWQHESVVDAQHQAFSTEPTSTSCSTTSSTAYQYNVGVPALKTLRRASLAFEKSAKEP